MEPFGGVRCVGLVGGVFSLVGVVWWDGLCGFVGWDGLMGWVVGGVSWLLESGVVRAA